MATVLGPDVLNIVHTKLQDADELLRLGYPGDDGSRQPVHTVYVPADRYTVELPEEWGRRALSALAAVDGAAALAQEVGIGDTASLIAPLVEAKLVTEPIEDLRLDFEDGYGDRGDATEDADAVAAADMICTALDAGKAPPFVGIRFKSLEAPTRRRGLRTLDLFLGRLVEHGPLPDGLVLTLPKVTSVDQVEAMALVCERLESAHGLDDGRLRFEVQMEAPQLIIGADGTHPVARLLHRASGRVSALHYGTYDYSDSLQIAAEYQSMEHPAADFAKQVMQVAVAGTGVRLSDGSTNLVPVGDPKNVLAAWRLHARLVRRSLEHGYYQGWDLHPLQLPTRFIATYAFYRGGLAAATRRLRDYLHGTGGTVMDEPATARALSRFVIRALQCGAATTDEVQDATGVTTAQLFALAHPKATGKEPL